MANINASIKLGSGFLLKGAPTDLKITAASIEERNSYVTANALYKGAIVYVEDEDKYFKFTGQQPSGSDFSLCFEDIFGDFADTNSTVNLTGDQTISGTKTFNTAPKIGSETITTQEYVNNKIQTGVTDAIGDTIQAHDEDLDSISALETEGYLYRGSDGIYNTRSITAKDSSVTVESGENGTTISLPVSGVTAQSYGPAETTSVDFGGDIVIPQITFDTYGRATTATNQTITLPSAPTDITGNAATATKLAISRNFSISGKVTAAEVSFDGSNNVVLNATSVTADTATKLATTQNITLSGAVTGSGSFDGSQALSINTTLSNFDASKITSGVIDIERLPKGALERLVVVEDLSALLLLNSEDVQEGDTIKIVEPTTINDVQYPANCLFYVTDGSVFTGSQIEEELETALTVYTAGTAASVPWSGITGKPSEFTPEAHTHTATDITSGILVIANGGTGNSQGKATGLTTARNFSISGKVTAAEVSFDGSNNVVLNATSVTADTADKLTTAQNITLSGAVTGSGSFDGSQELSISTTLKNSGVTANTYGQESGSTLAFGGTFTVPNFTVDAKGIVTNAGEVVLTLPANPGDTKVTQTVATDNAEYPLLVKSTTETSTVTSTSKFASTVTLNPSTGTISASAISTTGNITATGDITGARVFNAVWNDYAEFFPRGENTEEGDIIMLDLNSDEEKYIKAVKNNKNEFIRVVGVHSESFGHIIGGEIPDDNTDIYSFNIKNYIPVALAGRVPCKVIGKVYKGANIVPSKIPGVGKIFDPEINTEDDIIGYLVESDNNEDIRLLKIKI